MVFVAIEGRLYETVADGPAEVAAASARQNPPEHLDRAEVTRRVGESVSRAVTELDTATPALDQR